MAVELPASGCPGLCVHIANWPTVTVVTCCTTKRPTDKVRISSQVTCTTNSTTTTGRDYAECLPVSTVFEGTHTTSNRCQRSTCHLADTPSITTNWTRNATES
ncbi:hypothetical protein GY45DRAFT_1019452 [Cubamyces sp. BRFM 1775]|nr:hypothetical protein GY45DRAFT_1019452 [Cubamyces sp. BRFM 1775]